MKRLKGTVALLTAALFVIGCGGGGGGGTTTDTKVRVDLTGADWAAYSASPWQEINITNLPADKVFEFEPGQNGKYSVAIHCKGEVGALTIINATRNELSSIDSMCGDIAKTTYYVNGTVHGIDVENTDTVGVFMDESGELFSADAADRIYSVRGLTSGTYDLVVFERASAAADNGINRFALRRGITVDHNITGEDINLTSESIGSVEHNFTVQDGEGYTCFVSAGGTVAPFLGSGGPDTGKWYALESNTTKGDIYQFVAGRFYRSGDIGYLKIIFDGKSALNDPGDVSYDPDSAIALLDVNVSKTGDIHNLSYSPANNLPLKMYNISLSQKGKTDREIWVTSQWLGSETDYTQPPLEQLPNWHPEWSLTTSESLEWNVIAMMANRSISEAMKNILENAYLEYPLFKLEMLMYWSIESGTLP